MFNNDDQFDVLVIGAGTAGIPASIAAARAGAKVLLLEKEPIVGGTITGSYVAMPCGGPRTGIYQEMLDRLAAEHCLTGGTNWYLPSSWLSVMLELLDAEENLRVACGSLVSAPITDEAGERPNVNGAIVRGPDGLETHVKAAVTIDASGSGFFADMAGCECLYGSDARDDFDEPHAAEERGDFVQHCTWMYISQKIGDGPAFDMMRLDNVRSGVLVSGLGWFHSKPEEALRRDPGLCLHWGSAVECRDTRAPSALAAAQREALAAMDRDLALLRENGYAVHLAPQLGVRETRRVVGEHTICENDLRSGVLPEDTIAVGTYGLDIWGGQLSREESHVPGYGLPYRALVPRDADGLLLAGKIISGTHIAMSAYRVQPILSPAGQAAGVAAAIAAQSGVPPREVAPTQIQAALAGPTQNVQLCV